MARWVWVAGLLAMTARAAEVETVGVTLSEPVPQGPRLRTFIGGYTSGGLMTPAANSSFNFHVGPVGLAGDLGVQVGSLAIFAQLRGSSFFQLNYVQAAAAVEWSLGSISLGAGVGGGATLSLIPSEGARLRPSIVAPLSVGFTVSERSGSFGLRSIRANIELALLFSPSASGPPGFGGMLGVSFGSLRR